MRDLFPSRVKVQKRFGNPVVQQEARRIKRRQRWRRMLTAGAGAVYGNDGFCFVLAVDAGVTRARHFTVRRRTVISIRATPVTRDSRIYASGAASTQPY